MVLIPEMPGAHPGVFALGNHLVDNGFTVVIPSLFGTPGAPAMRPGAVPVMLRGCVAKEFAGFATNADRPVAHYLRALARDLNEMTPGKGVGVIGQCFTGGFALAAAVDDSVLAPVLSQPSLPFPLTPKQRRDPGLSEAELKIVERRAANEGLCALGLRFSEDPLVPARTVQDTQRPARRCVRGHRDRLEEGQRARLRQDGTFGADPGASAIPTAIPPTTR